MGKFSGFGISEIRKKVADNWGGQIYNNDTQKWEDFKPTVQTVIGDMDSLYKNTNNSNDNYRNHKEQNLVSIIGNLNDLWTYTNKGDPISLTEAIINENKDIRSDINNYAVLIGEKPSGDSRQVFDHISDLHKEDTQIRKDFAAADNTLQTNITNAYKVADAELKRLEALTEQTGIKIFVIKAY